MFYQKMTEYLNKCVKKDELSHAYIFYGPDEPSKKDIALKFAQKIINTSVKFHPDLMIITADADKDRSINTIRQLKKFLMLSPHSGKYKIVIIEAAENFNAYAQNALLKTFEEAPNRSIVILCAKTVDSILGTIASRGVKLPFWQQKKIKLPEDEKTIKILDGILNNQIKNPYNSLEKINDFKAVEIFVMWIELLRTKFLFSPSLKLYEILKISQNIYFKLNETNINPKLAYDELILNLWKL